MILSCAIALCAIASSFASTWRSALYPENWQPPAPATSFYTDAFIQDFSFAGYRRGEVPLPAITGPVFNVVTAYGADPTGATDSTVAIQNAINAAAAAGGGVVFLPAGEFRVSPQGANNFALRISTSNIVLRGAGHAETFLLNTSYTMNGKSVVLVAPQSLSFGAIRNLTADLDGPTRRIPVENAGSFAPGNIVRLEWTFTPEWVVEHKQETWWGAAAPGTARYLREVVAVNAAQGWIEIDVPTRYTMKTRDLAQVRTMGGHLAEVGVESLSIGNVQHPGTQWGEEDYTDPAKSAFDAHNSYLIRVDNTRDSWITGVRSRAAAANTTTAHMLSNGILLSGSFRMTVADSQMRRPQYGGGGGNGYMFRLQSSNDCLVRDFVAEFSRHGLVVSHPGTSGNVFFQCEDRETARATGATGSYATSGSGSDNHQTFSHSNLWDQCRAHNSFYTAHHRAFFGSTPPHGLTSAHGVYWNTSGSGTRYTNLVRSEQGRYGYVIGTSGTHSAATNPTGGNTAPADILEGIGLGATLQPQSLYLDQLARRLTPAILYVANGATGGAAPVDPLSPYPPNQYITVLGPGSLSRAGHVFTGWNTDPAGAGSALAPGAGFTLGRTTYLYAQWRIGSYAVTFDPQGGSAVSPASITVQYDAPYGPLPAPVRPGYDFLGWFTAPAGGELITAGTRLGIDSAHTLFARWNAPPLVDAGSARTVSLNPAAPWTPVLLSTTAWYDAADLASLTPALGAVTQWRDKSGRQRHLSQSDDTGRPLSGSRTLNQLNVLDFSADYLFTTAGLGESIRSVFLVTTQNTPVTSSTPGRILLSTAGGGVSTGDAYGSSTGAFTGEVLSLFDEDTANTFVKRQGVSSAVLPALPAGPHLHAYVFATDWFISLNGGENLRNLTSGATRNPMLFAPSFSIGAGARNHPALVEFFHDGAVAEVILLARTASLAERQTAEGYLAHKWGLTGGLPDGHPHKTAAPVSPAAVVTLQGSASSPDGRPLTYAWSVVGGPAPVFFADPAAFATTATFTVEGAYTLRLTASDGLGQSSDDVVVTIGAALPPHPFVTWFGGIDEQDAPSAFAADANADGVPDGLAWLLGAASPATRASDLLPVLGASAAGPGAFAFTFGLLPSAARGGAVVEIEYSADLAAWTRVALPAASGTSSGVAFDLTPAGGLVEVRATLPRELFGAGPRAFVRLRAGLPAP